MNVLRFARPVRATAGALALALLFAASPAHPQEARGTIVGQVSDPTGAAIPGATVTITSKAMGTKQVASTNENGFFQATYLIPGFYSV